VGARAQTGQCRRVGTDRWGYGGRRSLWRTSHRAGTLPANCPSGRVCRGGAVTFYPGVKKEEWIVSVSARRPAPNAGARAPPARQEGPGGVGAALDGSRHVPCPRRECVRGRVAPLCPFQIIASGGMLLREAPDSPPARQKGTGLWAVRAL
jgi:hypothetical protein